MKQNNSIVRVLLTASGGIHALGVIDCLRNNFEKRKFKKLYKFNLKNLQKRKNQCDNTWKF